jgi:hypothetical protein
MATYLEIIVALTPEEQELFFGAVKDHSVKDALQMTIDAIRVFDQERYETLRARFAPKEEPAA